jgi:hypothetical protein
MATRKQRRRREKLHRHEYVWEDEEGNELDPSEVRAERTSRTAERSGERGQRGGRQVDEPSWARTFKRSLIFAPLMFITVYLLGGDDITLAGKLIQTATLLAFFIPFSYFLDRIMWRSFQRRSQRAAEKR